MKPLPMLWFPMTGPCNLVIFIFLKCLPFLHERYSLKSRLKCHGIAFETMLSIPDQLLLA
eukprot:c55792_g1_i1 orf=87-266(+)